MRARGSVPFFRAGSCLFSLLSLERASYWGCLAARWTVHRTRSFTPIESLAIGLIAQTFQVAELLVVLELRGFRFPSTSATAVSPGNCVHPDGRSVCAFAVGVFAGAVATVTLLKS